MVIKRRHLFIVKLILLGVLVDLLVEHPHVAVEVMGEISMVDLVKKIEGLSSKSVEYNIVEYPDSYPADEPNRRAPDIRKARLQLDFKPQVDLDQGLKRFLDWANTVYTGEQ